MSPVKCMDGHPTRVRPVEATPLTPGFILGGRSMNIIRRISSIWNIGSPREPKNKGNSLVLPFLALKILLSQKSG